MSTFVLVHGSFHGAWCWFKLIPELEALGHRVVAIDLPAQGDDPTPVHEATLEMNVDRVVDAIEVESEPVFLVGHSFGGATITAAAERIPERIALLVYLTSFIPLPGESINDITSSPMWPKEEGARAFVRSADGYSFSVAPEAVRERFYHDCTDEDVDHCLARIRPQPFKPRAAPIHTTQERFGSVSRAYVLCSEDKSIPLDVQRQIEARMPCDKVVTIHSSHSPFLSAPTELAGVLSNLTAN